MMWRYGKLSYVFNQSGRTSRGNKFHNILSLEQNQYYSFDNVKIFKSRLYMHDFSQFLMFPSVYA